MNKYEHQVKEHIVKEDIITKHVCLCDHCKQEIHEGEQYWHGSTHHQEWGNDSIESYEYFDVHKDCLLAYIEEIASDPEPTQAIEFEMERFKGDVGKQYSRYTT